MDPEEQSAGETVDFSHRLQAKAFWQRWTSRRRPGRAPGGATQEPVAIPPVVWRHYRHFAWVVCEQRIFLLVLGFLLAACLLVWALALHLGMKPPVVVRAGPSLRQAAADFYGAPEISYDQLAFFLHGCLPLLYAADQGGHPLLPLDQGLVAPEIYREAESRLKEADPAVQSNHMTQSLTLTAMDDLVTDVPSGRAAAYLSGYLTLTRPRSEAQFYPWRAQVLLEVNRTSRLNPYPFFLMRCEDRTGPAALAWDKTRDKSALLAP